MQDETKVEDREQFNLNDPRLDDYVPEGFDPEADLESRGFKPPQDGRGWVRLFMRQPKDDRPNPYTKAGQNSVNVLVGTRPRIQKEDGSLGAYLADWYAMTSVMKGQKTSTMHAMAKQVGISLPVGLPAGEIKKRIREAFEQAGEAGLAVYGRWQMIREIPKVSEHTGEPLLNDRGYPEVERIYGRVGVLARNLADAQELAQAQTHMSEEEKQGMIMAVQLEPWKYYAEKDGSYELREARVVFELQAPPKG
jgi:hypothetical protein